jgi:hypothetical protein
MAALRHYTRLEKDGVPKTSIRRKLAENPLVTDLNITWEEGGLKKMGAIEMP